METETGCSVITMAVEKQDAEVETTQQAKPRGWLPAGGQAHRSCKRGAPAPIPGGRETRKWGDARPPVPRGCHQPFLGGPLGPKRTTGTSCAAGQGEGGSPRPSCPLAPRQPLTFLHRFAGGSFPASGAAGQALGGSSPGEAAAAAAPAAGGTAALGAQTGAGGGGSGPSSRHGDGRARRPPGPGRPGSRLSAWPGRGLGGLPPPPRPRAERGRAAAPALPCRQPPGPGKAPPRRTSAPPGPPRRHSQTARGGTERRRGCPSAAPGPLRRGRRRRRPSLGYKATPTSPAHGCPRPFPAGDLAPIPAAVFTHIPSGALTPAPRVSSPPAPRVSCPPHGCPHDHPCSPHPHSHSHPLPTAALPAGLTPRGCPHLSARGHRPQGSWWSHSSAVPCSTGRTETPRGLFLREIPAGWARHHEGPGGSGARPARPEVAQAHPGWGRTGMAGGGPLPQGRRRGGERRDLHLQSQGK